MKLTPATATFVGHYRRADEEHDEFTEQESLEGAQGVLFDCPLCGNHKVLCWFSNPRGAPAVPAEAFPRPGRWQASGTGLSDLTLSPSVNLDTETARQQHSCLWHGWVQAGEAT